MKIDINLNLFSIEAILKANYSFQDEFYTQVEKISEQIARVSIEPKSEAYREKGCLLESYQEELQDQQIRILNDKRFSKIRELIIEQAFKPISFRGLKQKVNKHEGK